MAIAPTHLLCQMQANSFLAEFLRTISQVQKEKENLAVACLHPPKNVKLGIFPVVDPGAVSRVGIDGGESFQERTREPLGCYCYRSSSTTHSNVCL